MRRFSDINLQKLMGRLNMPDNEPIRATIVTRAIQSAQTQVEQQNFQTRSQVVKYDEVLNQQRRVIYAARRRILNGDDLQSQVHTMLVDVITAYVTEATAASRPRQWDLDALWTALNTLYPVGIEHPSLTHSNGKPGDVQLPRKKLLTALINDAQHRLADREAEVDAAAGPGAMRTLERDVILDAIDRKWREHLYEMDYLKAGIGLRAMAQRDPLVEYQREGYTMFAAMIEGLTEECVGSLFTIAAQPTPAVEPDATLSEPGIVVSVATETAAARPTNGFVVAHTPGLPVGAESG